MATINFARREIEAKLVYCGPALSGKTTNLRVLHGLVPAGQRGDLHSLATDQERTLFFDYVPLELGQISGFKARFKLFTVPGQAFYRETRRVVLAGADGIVFVADSAAERAQQNVDALVDLEEHLNAHGLTITALPLVLQLNKRDVSSAMAVAEMTAELNPFAVPVVEAVARTGQGVMDTLYTVSSLAVRSIRDSLAGRDSAVRLLPIDRAEAEDERLVVLDTLEKITAVRPVEEARSERIRKAAMLRPDDIASDLLEEDAPAPGVDTEIVAQAAAAADHPLLAAALDTPAAPADDLPDEETGESAPVAPPPPAKKKRTRKRKGAAAPEEAAADVAAAAPPPAEPADTSTEAADTSASAADTSAEAADTSAASADPSADTAIPSEEEGDLLSPEAAAVQAAAEAAEAAARAAEVAALIGRAGLVSDLPRPEEATFEDHPLDPASDAAAAPDEAAPSDEDAPPSDDSAEAADSDDVAIAPDDDAMTPDDDAIAPDDGAFTAGGDPDTAEVDDAPRFPGLAPELEDGGPDPDEWTPPNPMPPLTRPRAADEPLDEPPESTPYQPLSAPPPPPAPDPADRAPIGRAIDARIGVEALAGARVRDVRSLVERADGATGIELLVERDGSPVRHTVWLLGEEPAPAPPRWAGPIIIGLAAFALGAVVGLLAGWAAFAA